MLITKWMLGLASLFLLGGCGEPPEPAPEPAPEPVPTPPTPVPVELTEFTFDHFGMMANDCFTFTVTETEDGVMLYLEENFSGGAVLETPADPSVLDQLEQIAGNYAMVNWDGFDKSNSDILDGSGFYLSMTLTDGRTITAHGNNAFPNGYSEAKLEILEIYRSLLSVELTE